MATVKSPLAAAPAPAVGAGTDQSPLGVGGVSVGSAGASGGYFVPQQQQQQQQQQKPYPRTSYQDGSDYFSTQQQLAVNDDDRTILNTIANAHIPATPPGDNAYPYKDGGSDTGANNNYSVGDWDRERDRERDRNMIAPTPTNTRPVSASALSRGGGPDWESSHRGSVVLDGAAVATAVGDNGSGSGDGASMQLPTRSNTLKKKKSALRRSVSLHRTASRRSMKAGSVRSLALQSHSDLDESRSAFYCPVPTDGNPTEVLANRFQSWRKILKDLIAYHREIQNHYEQRAKSVQKLSTSLNNATLPSGFVVSGGLGDAAQVLRNYHRLGLEETIRAREIEEDVILALTGLRSDLGQKVKEIKNISGDFKNSVNKEMDATKRAVKNLQDVLGETDLDPGLLAGRDDPYLLRLAVDHQLERQLEEENYLHQAYLNLEKSGRELEAIVVGEIQKSYNAYASILKREANTTLNAVDELRSGALAMPKDEEWTSFIRHNEQFVDPTVPIRSVQFIHYPGQDHYACQEIRAGLLERKSKYLKSYTAGWYVLSPTHLHEFKSADKMQAPVMSLYLPEQKLGSHSTESASSSKFVLKGRQTGSMHRGHTWVFRAETYDTMMAWYDDLKALTEPRTAQERSDYVRGQQQQQQQQYQYHMRSASRASQRTFSSDGIVNEDDEEPFAVGAALAAVASPGVSRTAVSPQGQVQQGQTVQQVQQEQISSQGQQTPPSQGQPPQSQSQPQPQPQQPPQQRPSGGRFPSDLQVNAQRGLQVQAAGGGVSPTSLAGSSGEIPPPVVDASPDVIAAAHALPGSQPLEAVDNYGYGQIPQVPYQQQQQLHQHQQQLQQQQLQQLQQQQQLQKKRYSANLAEQQYYRPQGSRSDSGNNVSGSSPMGQAVFQSAVMQLQQQPVQQQPVQVQQQPVQVQQVQAQQVQTPPAQIQQPLQPLQTQQPLQSLPLQPQTQLQPTQTVPIAYAVDGHAVPSASPVPVQNRAVNAGVEQTSRKPNEAVSAVDLHMPGDFPEA